jgi:hypothetical protein
MVTKFPIFLIVNKMAHASHAEGCGGQLSTYLASDANSYVDSLLFVDRTASDPLYSTPGGWSDYFYSGDPVSCNVK